MEYHLINNVTPPKANSANTRYPFNTMEVGQCVVFKIDDPDFSESSARMSASAIGRKHGKRFTSRIDRKDGVLRIWRVS